MNDLQIIHLSDLHIGGDTASYSKVLEKLLDDLQEQYGDKSSLRVDEDGNPIKDLVIAVTGDIFDKGPAYHISSQAYDNAWEFFNDLYQYIGFRTAAIYFVPGNHDKVRTEKTKFLIKQYRSLCGSSREKEILNSAVFDGQFEKDFWDIHLASYKKEEGTGYIELVKEVCAKFDCKYADTEWQDHTFGADAIKIADKPYCFIMMNTAWSCIDDYDRRQQLIGEFQIKSITETLNILTRKKNFKNPVATIVLAHHPIVDLYGEEEDRLFNYLTYFEGPSANAYLCGHTHQQNEKSWENMHHSMNTFMTGIGEREKANGRSIEGHCYARYVFNILENSIDVYSRKMDKSGRFDVDTDSGDVEFGKIKRVYPINNLICRPFMKLQSSRGMDEKAIYLSDELHNYSVQYMHCVQKLQVVAQEAMVSACDSLAKNIEDEIHKHSSGIKTRDVDKLKNENEGKDVDQIEEIVEDSVESNDANHVEEQQFINDDEIEKIYDHLYSSTCQKGTKNYLELQAMMSKYDDKIYQYFYDFIVEICVKMWDIFVGEEVKENDVVRFHFRYLEDRRVGNYKQLCASWHDGDEPAEDTDLYRVSDIRYTDLIKLSNEQRHPLIYSANIESVQGKLKNRWNNFITIVPEIDGNEYNYRGTHIPYITFGVTINNPKYDLLLYCMDCFGMKKTLEDILDRFIDKFCIDLGPFCESRHDEDEAIKKERQSKENEQNV